MHEFFLKCRVLNKSTNNNLKDYFMSKQNSTSGKQGSSKPCTPPNAPSKTGNPSGKGRGNCPPKK